MRDLLWRTTGGRVALAVLVIGFVSAGLIFAFTSPDQISDAQLRYGVADPRYDQQLRQLGGGMAVAMAQFHQWFDHLWHGRPLALTVAVLSVLIAAACGLVGYLWDGEHHDHDDAGR